MGIFLSTIYTLAGENPYIDITLNPKNPAPKSVVSFTVDINGDSISTVRLIIRECNKETGLCHMPQNISMSKVDDDTYDRLALTIKYYIWGTINPTNQQLNVSLWNETLGSWESIYYDYGQDENMTESIFFSTDYVTSENKILVYYRYYLSTAGGAGHTAWARHYDTRLDYYRYLIDLNDTTSPVWANFTWQNTSLSYRTVAWRIYFNDTGTSPGLENVTDMFTFEIGDTTFPKWQDNFTIPTLPATSVQFTPKL